MRVTEDSYFWKNCHVELQNEPTGVIHEHCSKQLHLSCHYESLLYKMSFDIDAFRYIQQAILFLHP